MSMKHGSVADEKHLQIRGGSTKAALQMEPCHFPFHNYSLPGHEEEKEGWAVMKRLPQCLLNILLSVRKKTNKKKQLIASFRPSS